MSVSPQHNPISPPTPAPSPQPELHSLLPSIAAANASSSHASTSSRLGPSPLSTSSTTFNHTSEPPRLDLISQLLSSLPLGQSQEKDVAILLALLGRVYPDLTSPKLKATFLSSLVSLCTLSDLTQLSSLINPRLKLDFFTSLPIEVSLLVLSFIDEPKTLARAMQVSSRWKSLVEDEGTWKGMCEKHRFEMEEDEEDDEDEEDEDDEIGNNEEDDNQAVQIASTSNLGLQENQIQSLNGIGNSGQGLPPPSTIPIPTSFSTSTSTPTPPTFASTSPSSISTPSHQTFPIPSTSSSSFNPISTSSNSNSNSLNQRFPNELPLLSKSSQDSLMNSIQLRFSGKDLNPFNASEDLKWFYQKLEIQNQNQVGSSIDSVPLGFEEIEKMNLIELILREECQERYGGLRADKDERSFFTKGKYNQKSGGGVDDDSMEIDTDSQSRFKSQPRSRFSTRGDQFVQVQGLGKGRPSPSPSPFKRNQSLRNGSRGNLNGGNRSVSFDNGSVGGRFNSPASPNNQKRTFSYRTHFKLAYLTESNWLRGGRLLTQHTSSDNGAVVTSLALDSEWIVVGMANSKIHVFDAKTGLFSKTLQGHESGVWCLCLVSKTEGLEKGLAKERSNTAGDSRFTMSGRSSRIENDLKLIHHDKRKNATSFSSSSFDENGNGTGDRKVLQKSPELSHPMPTYPINADGSRLAKDLVSKINERDEKLKNESKDSASHENLPDFNGSENLLSNKGKGKEKMKSTEEVTQENQELDPMVLWFYKSKNLLYQKEISSNSSYNRLRKSSPTPLNQEERTLKKAKERGIEVALAEVEAGGIRDSIMNNGGRIPMEFKHLTGNDDERQGGKGKGKEPSTSTSNTFPMPPPPTSFSNFGPFNAGVEGELGIGGDPHYVDENGMAIDDVVLQDEQIQDQEDLNEDGFNDDDDEDEDEEEDELLSRPYSPSDYLRAFGEDYHPDEFDHHAGDGDGEGSDEIDVEMKSFDSTNSFNATGGGVGGKKKNKDKRKSTTSSSSNSGGQRFNRSNEAKDNSHVLTGSSKGFGNEHALVISGACDRTVRVWDLRTGTCKHVLKGHTSTVRCLKVLDGRPLAVSGSRDSTLRVWDIKRGCLVHLLSGHQHSVRCIEVHGTRVVSGSYDCTARIWNVLNGECLNILRGHFHQIYAVAFDGKIVATGSLDSTVRVYDADNGKCLAVLQGHTSLVGQLQLTNSILITGGSDGRVIIFCLKTFQCLHRLCAHDNSVTCLQFDDKFIVTGGNDGKVKLWNFKTGAFIREICEPSEQVWKVSYRDDKCVVLCKREGKTSMDVITFRPPVEEV